MSRNNKIHLSVLISILLIGILVSLSIGYISTGKTLQLLVDFSDNSLERLILIEIRLPRVLLAVLVGASLGLAGLLAQGAFTNPLAEPSIIGASSGAALGSILILIYGINESSLIITAGVLGAMTLAFFTYYLAHSAKNQSAHLIVIIGIAISAVGIALVGIVSAISGNNAARSISFWYFGSVALAKIEYVYLMLIVIAISLLLTKGIGTRLDILAFGDSQTRFWGYSPNKIRFQSILFMSLLSGASVSMVGNIAFLGLAAPHIARSIFGHLNSRLIPTSMLVGSILLLFADTFARNISRGTELPLGFFTALIGAPILILLVRRSTARFNND